MTSAGATAQSMTVSSPTCMDCPTSSMIGRRRSRARTCATTSDDMPCARLRDAGAALHVGRHARGAHRAAERAPPESTSSRRSEPASSPLLVDQPAPRPTRPRCRSCRRSPSWRARRSRNQRDRQRVGDVRGRASRRSSRSRRCPGASTTPSEPSSTPKISPSTVAPPPRGSPRRARGATNTAARMPASGSAAGPPPDPRGRSPSPDCRRRSALAQADQRHEQADAHADRELQRHRHGARIALRSPAMTSTTAIRPSMTMIAIADRPLIPRPSTMPNATTALIPRPGASAEGQLRVQPHRQRRHRRRDRRRRGHGLERHARAREDRRVDAEEVAHRQERREAPERLGPRVRSAPERAGGGRGRRTSRRRRRTRQGPDRAQDGARPGPIESASAMPTNRDDFVDRFGPLFEDFPWVAEAAWERPVRQPRGPPTPVRAVFTPRRSPAPPHPRPPRLAGRCDRGSVPRTRAASIPSPAWTASRPRSTRRSRARRRVPRPLRLPVRDLRARAREDSILAAAQSGSPARPEPESRPPSTRSPRSPAYAWSPRREDLLRQAAVPLHRAATAATCFAARSLEVLGENLRPPTPGRQPRGRRHRHDEELHPARVSGPRRRHAAGLLAHLADGSFASYPVVDGPVTAAGCAGPPDRQLFARGRPRSYVATVELGRSCRSTDAGRPPRPLLLKVTARAFTGSHATASRRCPGAATSRYSSTSTSTHTRRRRTPAKARWPYTPSSRRRSTTRLTVDPSTSCTVWGARLAGWQR